VNNLAQRELESFARLTYVLLLVKCGVRDIEIYSQR